MGRQPGTDDADDDEHDEDHEGDDATTKGSVDKAIGDSMDAKPATAQSYYSWSGLSSMFGTYPTSDHKSDDDENDDDDDEEETKEMDLSARRRTERVTRSQSVSMMANSSSANRLRVAELKSQMRNRSQRGRVSRQSRDSATRRGNSKT